MTIEKFGGKTCNKFFLKDFTAAEASKILKGVDTVALSMAKAANSSGTFFTEAPNVGKSST